MMTLKRKALPPSLVLALLLSVLWLTAANKTGFGQQQPAAPNSPPQASSQAAPEDSDAKSDHQTNQLESNRVRPGRTLAEQEREAEGEEENANLKHSPVVQKLASLTGLSVHAAHMLALWLNFAIVAVVILWFARKTLPAIFKSRGQAIQRALEEARAASQEANRRLADIETRLRQMDSEIGKIKATAEKEAEGEEERIRKAAEEEIRKLEESARQEIAAASKQARRELSTHTADLAIALARKQIHVDSSTDQVLVRDFAAKLSANQPPRGGNGGPGKDGQ